MAERLTDRRILTAKPDPAKSLFLFDTEVKGLSVRIYPTGVKTFLLIWSEHGRQRRKTIGRAPAWSVVKARLAAAKLRVRLDEGETIAPERGASVADLAAQWLKIVSATRAPRTSADYHRLAHRHILPHFGKSDPRTITRNAVEAWHARIARGTPIEANRALATLSSLLSWLEHDEIIPANPCTRVKRRPENQRHIYLDDAEVAALHAVLDQYPDKAAALALKLCLMTGARIGEALALTLEQIDEARALWIKPASTTKQRRVHIAPLPRAALPVAIKLARLGSPGYPACRRCWWKAREAIGRIDAKIHDLRHTRASALARKGGSLLQIGKLLGHSVPATTSRYAHLVAADLADLVERSS